MTSFTMDIEMRKLSDLKAAEQNSRRHTPEQIEQIKGPMETFGWTIPVLIDSGGKIIAGHARVEAGRLLGIVEVPCVIADGWSEEKKEAYQITDNRLAELSDWDTDILGDQLKRLAAFKFDISFLDLKTGFEDLFKPILDPQVFIKPVTDAQIKKNAQETEKALTDQSTAKKTYTVDCPHCGTELEIEV